MVVALGFDGGRRRVGEVAVDGAIAVVHGTYEAARATLLLAFALEAAAIARLMAVGIAISPAIAIAEGRTGLVARVLRRALTIPVAKLLLPALGGWSGCRLLRRSGLGPATCSCACDGAGGCSSTAPCRAVYCARSLARRGFGPSAAKTFVPSKPPSGRAGRRITAPLVRFALNSCFHFLLRVGDSRFFPTRWRERYQVVLELRHSSSITRDHEVRCYAPWDISKIPRRFRTAHGQPSAICKR